MTTFNVGDRVRVINSIYNDPELTSTGDTIANGSLGTVIGTGIGTGMYTRVAVDGKEPWAPLFTDDEIKLAPAPSLIDDVRAKAAAKRAAAQQAQKETDIADAAYEEALFRTHALSREADALEAAAKILEEAK